ncbi:hypothetical protein [Archangium lansingense]|uniref:Uncharacterized protein n=1 Tax=Archangium lansingense TaxID=2995310 RepID=A0ABT4AEC8_9BACT|nr:hypothetical protein [Archangium lansinium]MCY1080033.1 hypothetical protein [Archangium lansinium]
MTKYKKQVTQASSQVESSTPSEEEQLGTQAQVASKFYQAASQKHIQRKLAKQAKDPSTFTEPYSQNNPLKSMLNLEMGHGVAQMRTSAPAPASASASAPAPAPTTGKQPSHSVQKFGSSQTTVRVPNEGARSGPSLLSKTTVALQGAGQSSKYSVMASRSTPIHPMQGTNPTFHNLAALEAARSGGRDQASVAAKMRLAQTGNLTPQQASAPQTHATFEQPDAQKPTPAQQRLIARNTGNTLKLWANGPGSSRSSSSTASAPAPSSSASSSSASSAPVPSVQPPGSPRGQRFISALQNMSSSPTPSREDLHEAISILSDVHGSNFAAPMSPVGTDSEGEAFEETFGTKPTKKGPP